MGTPIDPVRRGSDRYLAGNLLATGNRLVETTTYAYDNLYRRTEVVQPNGDRVSYAYNAVGLLTSLTDGGDSDGENRNTTEFTYDALNRLIAETNQLEQTRYFAYDDGGNRISEIDRNDRQRVWTYDGVGRETAELWLDDGHAVVRTIAMTYDEASQLLSVGDADSNYAYGYDLLGRQATVDNLGTPGLPHVVLSNNYDAAGNRTLLSASVDAYLDFRNDYAYDLLGRLTALTQRTQTGNSVAAKRAAFSYDAAGQYVAISRYSDVAGASLVNTSTYQFDAAGRLTSIAHGGVTTLGWQYDAGDHLDSFGNSAHSTEDADYGYDASGQLRTVDRPSDEEQYAYDATGNRVAVTNSAGSGVGYVTHANNQLYSDGVYTYAYDDEGNRISRTKTGESTTYAWDYRNRLSSVAIVTSDGTRVVQYKYDPLDRLLSRTETLNAVVQSTERFVHDGDQIILAFNGSNQLTHRYLWSPQAVDQLLADEQVTAASMPLTSAGTVYWALGDQLGSVRDVINNSGTVVGHVSYDGFGRVLAATGTVQLPFRYTGKMLDGATGLQWNLHRWYDASVGRWVSEDPIGFRAGDMNLYRYASDRPFDFTDPSGLWTWTEETALEQLRAQIAEWRGDGSNFAANLLQHFIDKKGPQPYRLTRADIAEVSVHSALMIRELLNQDNRKFDWEKNTKRETHFSGHVRWWFCGEDEASYVDSNLFRAYGGADLTFKGMATREQKPRTWVGGAVIGADIEVTIKDHYTFLPTGFLNGRLLFKSYSAARFLETDCESYKPFDDESTFKQKYSDIKLGPAFDY